MLDTLIASVKEKHKQKPITPEAYRKWRMSGVTKRLMEELEIGLLDMYQEVPTGGMEERAMKTVFSEGRVAVAENVLTWKPQELVGDDDE